MRTAWSPPRSTLSRSSLESWVETSEMCVAPRLAMDSPGEIPGDGSATVAPASRHRNSMESPPTWYSGNEWSHLSPGRSAMLVFEPRALW
jgi:hypothetical protein